MDKVHIPKNEYEQLLKHIKILASRISLAHAILANIDCEEWCGKSPTKHDDGKCHICRTRKALEKRDDK